MQQYYYQQLTKPQKSVYDALLAAVSAFAPSVRVLHLSPEEMRDVYCLLRLDHPEIFYLKDYSLRFYPGADYAELHPVYLLDKGKLREQQQALSARCARLLRPVKSADEAEKLVFIHRFITGSVRYDKLKKEYSHEIVGPLVLGVSVCEGIAKTVKYLCTELGIECIVVLCDNDPENGVRYRHTWNLIRTGGQWLHYDMTFDLSLGSDGCERFDYFGLGDRQIFRDHRPPIYPVPSAPEHDRFHYRQKGLSFTKAEDADKRIRQALRKRQTDYVFHWRGGAMTRAVTAELLTLAQNAAQERGKCVEAALNVPQAVLALHFSDGAAEPELVEQDTSEIE